MKSTYLGYVTKPKIQSLKDYFSNVEVEKNKSVIMLKFILVRYSQN